MTYGQMLASMAVAVGSLATLGCEPRQIRKEAAVMVDACAEVSLIVAATH